MPEYHPLITTQMSLIVQSMNMLFLNMLEDENIDLNGEDYLKDLMEINVKLNEINQRAFMDIDETDQLV